MTTSSFMTSKALRWTAVALCLLTLILVPFFLFGPRLEAWAAAFREATSHHPLVTALVLGGLLAGDILLPVPSSIVSTACGHLLGFTGGLLTSWLGMTLSCAVGFWLGRWGGAPLTTRLVGAAEMTRLHRLFERLGSWVVIVSRPVPVLAEVSVLVAGMARMSAARFLVLSSLANLGISAAYAAVGAWSASNNAWLAALASAIGLPWLAMRLTRQKLR